MKDIYRFGPHQYEIICHDLADGLPHWTVTAYLHGGLTIESKIEWFDWAEARKYARRLCRGALTVAEND